MGGNKQTKFLQVIALVLSFMFISYWHGLYLGVTIWSVANFSMIVAELFYFGYIKNKNKTTAQNRIKVIF